MEVKFPGEDRTLVRTFEDTELLRRVVEHVKGELQKETLTLWNTHPRRQYKSADLQLPLAGLGLRGRVRLLGMSGGGYSAAPSHPPAPAQTPARASSSNLTLVLTSAIARSYCICSN